MPNVQRSNPSSPNKGNKKKGKGTNSNSNNGQHSQGQPLNQQQNPQSQSNSMEVDREPTSSDLMTGIINMRGDYRNLVDDIIKFKKAALETINELEKTIKTQSEQISDLKKRIVRIEKDNKKQNVIISGVPEDKQETSEMLNNKIINILQNELKTNITPSKIHRFGPTTQRNKYIRVTLPTEQDKFKIFSNIKNSNLRKNNIFINEDLPKETNYDRKLLRDKKKEETAKGSDCVLKGDKIKINNIWHKICDGKIQPIQQNENTHISDSDNKNSHPHGINNQISKQPTTTKHNPSTKSRLK